MSRHTPARFAVLLAFTGVAIADDGRLDSPLEDRFRLTAGVFSVATDTRLRIDADNGAPGTLLTAEDDLGLRDRSELADVDVQMYLRPRHKIRLNYFQLDRGETVQLQRQIAFGNQVYFADDMTESRVDISDFALSYSYQFLRRERVELGAGVGLHLVQFDGAVRVPARLIEEEESGSGPALAPALEAMVRLTDRIHAEARFEYLYVKIDDVRVRLRNLRSGVFYRFNNNMAAGLGYGLFEARAFSSEPGDSGFLNFSNKGPQAFLRVSF